MRLEGISEAEVWEALPARDEAFLRQYAFYGYNRVGSHVGYSLMTGLALMAATCHAKHVPDGVFIRPTYPNLYCLIVGPSGGDKNIAMDTGIELLAQAAPPVLSPDPASEEALMKLLSRRGTRLWYYPEFAVWLANTNRKQHRANLRDALTDLYDCGLARGRERSDDEKSMKLIDPRPCILAACTPSHIESHTSQGDWEGGFMGRMLSFYGVSTRTKLIPDADPDRRAWLLWWLQEAFGGKTIFPCLGWEGGIANPETGSPGGAAWQRWSEWATANKIESQRADSRVTGPISRANLMAAKIATIFAADYGGARNGPWWMTLDLIDPAIRIADLHKRSILAMADRIMPTPQVRDLKLLFHLIPDTDRDPVPHAKLLRDSNFGSFTFKNMITTLVERGEVEVFQAGTHFYYRKRTPEEVQWDSTWAPA